MGLTHGEIRKLLNTCCRIILEEIDKREKDSKIYSFFGQWYDKDNKLKRLSTKRFTLYGKQVTTFFSDYKFFHFKQNEINLYCLSSSSNKYFSAQVESLLDKLTIDNNFIAQFMTKRAIDEFLTFD